MCPPTQFAYITRWGHNQQNSPTENIPGWVCSCQPSSDRWHKGTSVPEGWAWWERCRSLMICSSWIWVASSPSPSLQKCLLHRRGRGFVSAGMCVCVWVNTLNICTGLFIKDQSYMCKPVRLVHPVELVKPHMLCGHFTQLVFRNVMINEYHYD